MDHTSYLYHPMVPMTCSKELTRISLWSSRPVWITYRSLFPEICHAPKLRKYGHIIVCLPLITHTFVQGSNSHVTASGSMTQPADVLQAAGASVRVGCPTHVAPMLHGTAVQIPIWPYRRCTSPSEWSYVAQMTCAGVAPHSTQPESSGRDSSSHDWQTLHIECARPSVLRTRRYDLSDRPKRAHTSQITPHMRQSNKSHTHAQMV